LPPFVARLVLDHRGSSGEMPLLSYAILRSYQ
jgi:hypothetical protein